MKIPKLETKKQKIVAASTAVLMVSAVGVGAYLYSQKAAGFGFNKGENQLNMPEKQDLNLPDRDADIMGIVESVKGNQVTVLKLDASSMPQMNRDDESGNSGENASGGSGQKRERLSREMPQGERPTGTSADGASAQRPTGGASDTMISELKAKSTGTEIITVPVGITMYKESGMGQWSGATLTDLSANSMVTIWLNSSAEGENVAEALQIGMGGGR